MQGTTRSIVREYVETALWVLALTFLVRAFVIQAFRIPSGSMENTLLVGDFLFVSKLEYGPKIPFTGLRLPGLRAPRRGDVIVFQYPEDPSKDFIKRCIATGGQTIEERHKQVAVDGARLYEPYVIHIDNQIRPAVEDPRDYFGPFTVPSHHLFMMGDNRDNSSDSRFWGPLDTELIRGRAMFLYWSWDGDKHRPRWDRLFKAIR